MSRPVVIDYCCCEGGVSMGYHRAGADVYGVDLFEDFTQDRYPFPSLKMDALTALEILCSGGMLPFPGRNIRLADVTLQGGSPPCQLHSITNAARKADYPDLIGPMRDLFNQAGKPYIMENVVGAPLHNPLELCGCMFDLHAPDADGVRLNLWRPRQFETNLPLTQPRPGRLTLPRSTIAAHDPLFHAYPEVAGVYGGSRKAKRLPWEYIADVAPRDRHAAKHVRKGGYVPRSKAVAQTLLGIDWMTWSGMHQSIPPVFAEHLGREAFALIAAGTTLVTPAPDLEPALF